MDLDGSGAAGLDLGSDVENADEGGGLAAAVAVDSSGLAGSMKK